MVMNRAQREQLAEELGLNLPLHQQYFHWLQRIISGEFGTSFYGYQIANRLWEVLPTTLLIFLTGTIIAFLIGQWLGKVTAWKGKGFLTGTATFAAVSLYTSFPAWLGFLLVYFLVRRFNIFPQSLTRNPFAGFLQTLPIEFSMSPAQIMTRMLIGLTIVFILVLAANTLIKKYTRLAIHPLVQMGLVLGGWIGTWYIFGFGVIGFRVLHLAGIAILTYVLLSMGETMLVMQTSMRDTLNEEYIRTARGKGLPERRVRDVHAVPNAIIPVFSRLVVSLPYLLTGIVIIEYAVEWPGMGDMLYTALYQQDIPVVMAVLLIVGLISMFARLILELLELYLDPRLRDQVASATVDMNGK
jgi:peptide/nickel transport system permease protein